MTSLSRLLFSIFQLFFSMQGRIPRSTYLLGSIFLDIILIIFIFVSLWVKDNVEYPLSTLLNIIGFIIVIYPSIAVRVKRCHDRGYAGWILGLGLIPPIGIWLLIEFTFLPGTTGPNRYGDDPLQDDELYVAATCPACGHTWMGHWQRSFKSRQCPQCGKGWRVA